MQFNSGHKGSNARHRRYSAEKETLLSIYIAILVHSETRSRAVIDKLHDLGLCISYHRMLSFWKSVGNNFYYHYERDEIVCPSNLKLNLFTIHALDNIDHNSNPRTVTVSFHGTAITTT